MLLRLSLKLTFALGVACLLLVGSVRVLSFDPTHDARMRAAFSAPAHCPTFCYMGLYSGMTVADALDLLHGHEWVQSVHVMEDRFGEVILWRWSGKQPAYIHPLRSGSARVSGGRIVWFAIRTTIPLGEIWFSFGPPEQGLIDPVYHFMDYPQYGFGVRTRTSCVSFWNTRSEVIIAAADSVLATGLNVGHHLGEARRRVCDGFWYNTPG